MTRALLLFVFLAPQAFGASLPEAVLKALQTAQVPPSAVAIVVQPLDSGRPLIEWNADRPMNPASTMKLVTTSAALELLGPAYTWKTDVAATEPVSPTGVLHGNLYFKGYGDPTLTLERFWLLLRELRMAGVREIRGNVVLDQSYFAAEPETAFDNGTLEPYNVPPAALTVNFRSLRVRIVPNNSGVSVAIDPPIDNMQIENRIVPRAGPCTNDAEQLAYALNDAGGVVVQGSYAASCGVQSLYIAVPDHTRYFAGVFRWLWTMLGGSLSGEIRAGLTPRGATTLLTFRSKPLSEAVRDINKFSNNLMARQLLLTIAAEKRGAPGTRENGADAIRGWLRQAGLNMPELVIENGAGLSRSERISARSMAALLRYDFAKPIMPDLMASLPMLGVDGTVRKRFTGTPIAGRGYFKTGSLDGVKTLAGYMMDASGKRYAVVFLANHAAAAQTLNAQNALLDWIYAR